MGTFAAAQTAQKDRTVRAREGSSGQVSGLARTVKPSERRAPGTAQRKDGAVVHSDYSRRADERSKGNLGGIDGGSNAAAHASARSDAQSNARTGENPIYEQSGNSGTNPMHALKGELRTSAGASNSQTGQPQPDASRKHLAGVKYQNRAAGGQQPHKPPSKEHFKQEFGQVQASKR